MVANKKKKFITIESLMSDDVFEVEYLCNEWVKKDGVNANLVQYDWPNFKYLH